MHSAGSCTVAHKGQTPARRRREQKLVRCGRMWKWVYVKINRNMASKLLGSRLAEWTRTSATMDNLFAMLCRLWEEVILAEAAATSITSPAHGQANSLLNQFPGLHDRLCKELAQQIRRTTSNLQLSM